VSFRSGTSTQSFFFFRNFLFSEHHTPQASASAFLFHYHGCVLVSHNLLFLLTCFVSSYTLLAHLEQSTLQRNNLVCMSADHFWDVERSQTSNIGIECCSRKSRFTHEDMSNLNMSPIASRDLWGGKLLGHSSYCVFRVVKRFKAFNYCDLGRPTIVVYYLWMGIFWARVRS
jgi:hypothetical protein